MKMSRHVLVAICFASVVIAGEAPVCFSSSNANCDDHRANQQNRNTKQQQHTVEEDPTAPCQLYLAQYGNDAWGLYTGVKRISHELLYDQQELMFVLHDPNLNEWSPWHDVAWTSDSRWLGTNLFAPLLFQHHYLSRALLTGIGALATCTSSAYPDLKVDEYDSSEWAEMQHMLRRVKPNVRLHSNSTNPNMMWDAGVYRARDATAGSFTYYAGMYYTAARNLQAGEQLFVDCYSNHDVLDASSSEGEEALLDEDNAMTPLSRRLSMEYLHEFGVCLDSHLDIKPSRIPGAGRGAFAQRAISTEQVVEISPVLHFDRSQLEIVKQQIKPSEQHKIPLSREHGIEYTDQVTGQQVLLNYCYGHEDSNVLLLPLAPAVNFINHAPTPDQANVYIRWPYDPEILGSVDRLKSIPIMEFYQHEFGTDGSMLALEFVALRDIAPGDELYLDYGADWANAMQAHKDQWKDLQHESNYMSAHDYLREHANKPFRTLRDSSLPDHLRMACHFVMDEDESEFHEAGSNKVYEWIDEDIGCLRPCELLDREQDDAGEYFYTARIFPLENRYEPSYCGDVPIDGVLVSRIPSKAITVVDKPYTTDMHLPQAFRHAISVPDELYPRHWMMEDENPNGDFIGNPLPTGVMAPVRWQDNAEVVTPWAFRVGLGHHVRDVLLDYCDKMGIIDVMRHITASGNALQPGTNTHLNLKGYNWYLQRPDTWWNSNLQWLSPSDSAAHENYLQALSVAGFDQVLTGIGEYLGMEGLVAFHLTFMAVSFSNKGYAHYDVRQTGAKTFNIIVPLILANRTAPELDIEASDEKRMGRYRYEYGVGGMMGDNAIHGTSAVDYRRHKEMRLAATVYIADVREDYVDGIMKEYTQAYPPPDRELLLRWAGRHWRRNDPTIQLPKAEHGHVLYDSHFQESNQ